MSLEIAIQKQFKNFTLDIQFTAGDTFVGLLGASGSGKSMTLKCIAGIEKPDSGYIRINGKTVFDSANHINIPPQQRHCGFLFQNYALFPNMTVKQNIAIVLSQSQKANRDSTIADLLTRFDLQNLANHYPRQLSGGQQQRVALARMIATQPEIMLFDEPFSALDSFLKVHVEEQVQTLLADYHKTALFVSHNRDEVFTFCPSVCIIHKGQVHRIGTCNDIFINPQTVIAAQLTGCKNITPCKVIGTTEVFLPEWNITLHTLQPVPSHTTHIGIRAHYIKKATGDEKINLYDCYIQKTTVTPFSVSHTLMVPEAKKSFIWEYSVDTGTANGVPSYTTAKKPAQIKVCIPPHAILFLQNTMF
ncbi:MAG: ATP-binding cassette domain-containing protein [Treponema sp.]|nr:ATP-binding cassette domain-containing protein [Treponema sp.]